MRKELEKIENYRGIFTGTFVRYGLKRGWNGIAKETILLLDIKDDKGNILSDHLWFNLTKGFSALDLKVNDRVQFEARVTKYLKGYFGYRDDVYKPVEIDYKLSYPTKLKLLGNDEVQKVG